MNVLSVVHWYSEVVHGHWKTPVCGGWLLPAGGQQLKSGVGLFAIVEHNTADRPELAHHYRGLDTVNTLVMLH